MSIPQAAVQAQEDAHALADMGVPIFTCRLAANGDPYPPDGWERTKPGQASHAAVDRWKNGQALCAVTGVVYDVIDIDPRNGGQLSFKRLAKKLGEDGPFIFWEVATASGGMHLYIDKLNIGSSPGFMPGIDLKGGLKDGSSRGFVFLPPTVRPSKADSNTGSRVAYRAKTDLYAISGDTSIAAIRKAIPELRDEGKLLEGKVVGTQREDISDLKKECLSAPAGAQRTALLRYTHELERKGYDRNDILTLLAALVKEMPQYDKRRPWRAVDLRGLLHKPGEVIPDAMQGELGSITANVRKGGLQSYGGIVHEKTRWAAKRLLAFGDATILDGDAGLGKSLVTLDFAARLASGRPMPMEPEAYCDPLPVLLLAPEDRASVTAGRLQAALADPGNVWRPQLGTVEIERKTRAGKSLEKRATYDGDMLVFPDAIRKFRTWIKEYGIRMVVIDPISAFLSERINSANDASVRRALEPLCVVLGEMNCTALMVRHLNKNTTQDAKYRGGGSVAFGAVARIQLLAGELPDGTGRFGIGQVKNNHLARRPNEVMTYEIQDSNIVADEDGNMVPCIHWGDYIDMSLRSLVGGEKRGPKPEQKQEIQRMLEQLFAESHTWSVKDIQEAMTVAGISFNHKTAATARDELGIEARPTFLPGGGVKEWVWTTEPRKHRRNG